MLTNLQTVTTSQYIRVIVASALCKGFGHDRSFTGVPVFAWGEAGVGKTYGSKAAANELTEIQGREWQHGYIPANHYSPTDSHGARTIPLNDEDPFVKYLYPDWAKGLDPNKPAIILIDELTKATGATQNSWLGAIEERRSGAFEWGREWVPVITGNLPTAKAGDKEASPPARSRTVQVIVANSEASYLRDYAEPANLHYKVTTFIKYHGAGADPQFPKGVLNTWDPATNPAAFATERGWDHLSQLLVQGAEPKMFAAGMLGNDVGNAFIQHCEVLDAVPDLDEVLDSPKTAPVPDDVHIGYYAMHMLAFHATPSRMDAICTYARRLPSEVAVMGVTECVRRHPKCKETPAYIAFRCDYKLTV